jgi:hypothetical protein
MHSEKRRRERSFYSMDPLRIAKEIGYANASGTASAQIHRPKQGLPSGGFMRSVIDDAREAQRRRDPEADLSGFDTAVGEGETTSARASAPMGDTGWAECEDDNWSTATQLLSPMERELLSPVVEGIRTPGAISDQALLHFHREVSCELDRRLRSR